MPITEAHAERLNLLPMVARNRSVHGTNFTVSIEAASGVTTGISAATARTPSRWRLPQGDAADIVQPGTVPAHRAGGRGGWCAPATPRHCCTSRSLPGFIGGGAVRDP